MTLPPADPAPPRPRGPSPRSSALGVWLLVFALLWALFLARLAQTPIGGWAQSLFAGSGIRWEEAYRALGADEATSLPRHARESERERLLLANASVEDEPPAGVDLARRLHAHGSLAHLRYETFDAEGRALEAWAVRALVPELPFFGRFDERSGPLGPLGCPPGCREALARHHALLLERSGDPGLADEWVLRMPIGRPLDLGARPIATQDLLDPTPHRIALQHVRVPGANGGPARVVPRPARVRVTLIEVCPASVRVGALTRLVLYTHSILPIPRGLETERWVQLEGCAALLAADGAPSSAAPPPDRAP